MKKILSLLAVLLLVPQVALSADKIAVVDRAKGETFADQTKVTDQSALHVKQLLRTGVNSRLEATFIDGTRLYLGDHSELLLDEMVYQAETSGKAHFELKEGVFRMVSGLVNKVPGGQLTLKTPFTTIGIRGTDFWGHQTQDRLTMAVLDNGRVEIQVGDQTVVLDQPLKTVVIEKDGTVNAPFILNEDQLAAAVATIAW